MKKANILILCIGFIVMLSSSQTMAFDLYGFGSYWDQGESNDGKWGGGVGMSLPLFTDYIRLDTRAYYFESSDLPNGDKLTLIPLDIGLQVHILPDAVVDPYVLGGATYMFAEADRFDVDADFGGYIGGGLEWALPSSIVKLYGELMYRFHSIDAIEGDHIEDVDISGWTGNVGLKLSF